MDWLARARELTSAALAKLERTEPDIVRAQDDLRTAAENLEYLRRERGTAEDQG